MANQYLIETRTQESSLPKELKIGFIDINRTYDPSEQHAERITTESNQVKKAELPIVLTATEAAKIAETRLESEWLSRVAYEFDLPWKYSTLDPGDVITLDLDRGEYVVRIISIDYGKPGVVSCRAVAESAAVYSPVAVAEDGQTITEVITLAGGTRYIFMNLPCLREEDNDHGFYWAACGLNAAGWPGAILFRSTDTGLTFQEIDRATDPAVMGRTTDILADGPHTIIDNGSTVNVTLYAGGALESISEATMRSGGNPAAIGADGRWEIIKFQNATLESDGSYTIDTLIRGMFGTDDWAETHAAGDTFVLLSADTVFRAASGSDFVGELYNFKCITAGTPLSETDSETFTNEGVARKPTKPEHIKAIRDASGNMTISWTRSARYGLAWRDYVTVPLCEDTASYEVDIMEGNSPDTVYRTIAVSTTSASYTAAQQTTDFGAAQTSVRVKVYQLSATIGRGFAGEATV